MVTGLLGRTRVVPPDVEAPPMTPRTVDKPAKAPDTAPQEPVRNDGGGYSGGYDGGC